MNEFTLSLEEPINAGNEPHVTLILKRGNDEVVRRDALVFSEDELIAASNELTSAGDLNAADVDQYLAELIEPIRISSRLRSHGIDSQMSNPLKGRK